MIPPTNVSYIITELAEHREQYFNAVAPPIVQTSNFAFETVEQLRKAFEDEMRGNLYSRGLNPTVDILRRKLAALDGAEDCLLFNSGAAAIYAGVMANVKAGDHIISVEKPYSWAQKLFDVILPRFGVTTSYVDGREVKNFEAAVQFNTTLIYLESPNSLTYALQDLQAVAQLATRKNITTIIDNSYCTPLYQQPIALGIDICLQSATKFIGGHSDTLGGVLTGRKAMMKKIFDLEYLAIGSGLQPFNAWLLLRGLRTLPVRLQQISSTTALVYAYLNQHQKIKEVIYPFAENFPQFSLAKKQMKGAAGLLTFSLKNGTYEKITRFCENLKHILMAVSWGGYESLILPKCAGITPAGFDSNNTEHQYIRLYTGLEDASYIIADLEQSLATI